MRKIVIMAIMLCIGIVSISADTKHNLDSLINVLDKELTHYSKYLQEYELVLSDLKDNLRRAKTDNDRYNLNKQLYYKYQSFQNDSAIHYLNTCATLAKKMGRMDCYNAVRTQLAMQCSMMGCFYEAVKILEQVDRRCLDHDALVNYYTAQIHVNSELLYYTNVEELRQQWMDRKSLYRDSLFAIADVNGNEYLRWKGDAMFGDKKFAEAEKFYRHWLHNTSVGSHEYATAAFFMFLVTNVQGRTEEAKYYLIVSAISDIRNVTLDQASLWTLAEIISDEGDSRRSYNYIDYSCNMAQRLNTRLRVGQILPVLSIIEHSYQKKLSNANNILVVAVVVVCLMFIITLLLLFYIRSSRNKLRKAHDEVAVINGQLKNANEALAISNMKMNESNRVKEEYIGRFLSMCSLYIKKIEEQRKRVNKMVKAKQYDELYKVTCTMDMKKKELDELYSNFDATFLHLFPNFVNEFNELLEPEGRIITTDPNKLTTTLRIFALVRLGIDDSAKIAEFLDYSVHTVYNYRVRVRNSALGDRNEFEKKVKNLGLP